MSDQAKPLAWLKPDDVRAANAANIVFRHCRVNRVRDKRDVKRALAFAFSRPPQPDFAS